MYAVHELGNKRINTVVLLVALLATACTSVNCPPEQRLSGEALVQVVHIEGSDGPTTYGLTIYESGVLALRKFGGSARCKKVDPEMIEGVKKLVDSGSFEQASGFEGFLGHQEWMQVTHAGTTRRFIVASLPPVIQKLFSELDQIYFSAFGPNYDWTLLSSASGP